MRRIAVVTTSRADYGIYRPLLHRLAGDPRVELTVLAGGPHLVREHGLTIRDIEADGFSIGDRVELLLQSDSPEAVAVSMGLGTQGFARAYARLSPDVVIVLGDRFEMHAAAVAATPFRLALAHIHGGELSLGATDDAWRHSITKLSHLHFVSTEIYRQRVAQMGEEEWRIRCIGALGLDNLDIVKPLSRKPLEDRLGVGLETPPLVVTLHPETRGESAAPTVPLLAVLAEVERPIVITAPNADAGHLRLRRALQDFVAKKPNARLVESLGTAAYFGLLGCAAAMLGNSSSGLLEAPSFALPVVNIGRRQDGRIRGANVIDCPDDTDAIRAALARALDPAFRVSLADAPNPYRAESPAAPQILETLVNVPLGAALLDKRFVDRR